MAKKKKAAPPRPLTKKQRTRAEREARMNRWLIFGTIAVSVAVVGILLYGYLAEFVFRAREPVATVAGTPITTAEFEKRVRYQRLMLQQQLDRYRVQRMSLDPTDPEMAPLFDQLDEAIRELEAQLSPEYAVFVGQQVLDQMVQEEIIRQEAARRGITVSQEEIDRAIEQEFGYEQEASAEESAPLSTGPVTETEPLTPTTSLTREEFEQLYQDFVTNVLDPSGLGEAGFRAMVEVSLLYDKVRQALTSSVPSSMDQVKVRYVAFPAQEDADQMVERLDGGAKWEDLVAEIEADEESTAYANELDWRTKGYLTDQFGEEVAQAVFDTPVEGYGGPVLGSSGRYYVFQVLGHEERELDPLMRSFEESRAVQEWFKLQQSSVEYSEDWQGKVPAEP